MTTPAVPASDTDAATAVLPSVAAAEPAAAVPQPRAIGSSREPKGTW